MGGASKPVRGLPTLPTQGCLPLTCVPLDSSEKLQLVRFKGRPGELSPKARFWLFAGWLLPERFK
jgi:Cytochrome c/c1 heme lyase